ncbi:MAG: GntR family transcriptional regulator [Pseudomonadota bacterium]
MKKGNVTSLQNGRPTGSETNLTRRVYEQIKEMMQNYEIIPGQRLIFVDLAKRLGVSRTPVNNALSILAYEGFLDFVPNQGYKVHQITEEEAESLYEIREIIELGSIGKAIRKLTPEKLDILKRKKELYEKAVADQVSRGRFILDQEFHACHVQLSENLYLAEYFREVYQRIFLRHRIEGLRADRARAVVTEHDEIFEAMELKDVERARESIKSHIASGKQYIYSVIFGK